MDQPKQHYFLITGDLLFSLPGEDGKEQIIGQTVSAALAQESVNVGVHAMTRAQRIMQHMFLNNLQDPNAQVKHITITNVCHLGHMTKEEFEYVTSSTPPTVKTVQ